MTATTAKTATAPMRTINPSGGRSSGSGAGGADVSVGSGPVFGVRVGVAAGVSVGMGSNVVGVAVRRLMGMDQSSSAKWMPPSHRRD